MFNYNLMMQLHPIRNHHLLRYQPGDKAGCFTIIKALGGKRFRRGIAIVFQVKCDCGHLTERDRQSLIKNPVRCTMCNPHGTYPAGWSVHPMHKQWWGMIDRCITPKRKSYSDYGGRGIKVCDRWRWGDGEKTGFECYLDDMGVCPPGLTLERLDSDADYSPENCIWADRTVQSRNRRSLRIVEYQGKSQPVSVWAEEYGIPYFTLMTRLKRGWATERALTEPIRGR